MTRIALAAIALLGFTAAAHAMQCPANLRQIDAALQSNTSLSAQQKQQVTTLRNEGEKLHQGGQHQQSMAKLAEAKKLLGLQ